MAVGIYDHQDNEYISYGNRPTKRSFLNHYLRQMCYQAAIF
nr:hypothetical protein [Aliivibrio fischeri]